MYTLNYSTYVKLKNWKKIFVESEINAMVTFGCLVPGWVQRYLQSSDTILFSDLVFTLSVQSLSHVGLFSTQWTAACQASLSITNFWSLFRLMSIKSVMPSNHLTLCHSPYMDCHSLLQGIFLTQGSNPGLLYYRLILYHLSYQGRPYENTAQSTLKIFAHSMFLYFCSNL